MFINNNGTVGGDQFQGETVFFDSSTADHGTFINKGSTTSNFGNGGQTAFLDTSSAGNAMRITTRRILIGLSVFLAFLAGSQGAAGEALSMSYNLGSPARLQTTAVRLSLTYSFYGILWT